MTENKHDVDYADPDEEQKGNFEQKVPQNYIKLLYSINHYIVIGWFTWSPKSDWRGEGWVYF